MTLGVWESDTEFVHINTSESRQTTSRGQYIKPIAFPPKTAFHNPAKLSHIQSRLGKPAEDAAVWQCLAAVIMSDNRIFRMFAKPNELKQSQQSAAPSPYPFLADTSEILMSAIFWSLRTPLLAQTSLAQQFNNVYSYRCSSQHLVSMLLPLLVQDSAKP